MELREESLKQIIASNNRKQLNAKTKNQGRYLKAMETSTVTICTGPAGTGKTYMACGIAAQLLKQGRIEQIVLTRPLVECDEETGTLPGTLYEKVADSMRPMLDAVHEFISPQETAKLMREDKLVIVPLAKMRGRTFKNSIVILDEAQNATYRQLRMFLTRLGSGSKMVVCGDHTQSDLPYNGRNSLLEVINRFKPELHASISIVRLGREDIVRHELIQWMDERLTGAVQVIDKEDDEQHNNDAQIPSYHSSSWTKFLCPECETGIMVETWAKDENILVQCCNCMESIELLDENNMFDPIIVEGWKSDYLSVLQEIDDERNVNNA